MSYIHPQKSNKYNVHVYITDTSPLCHVKVSLPDPHIYLILVYTPTEVNLINICIPTISLTHPLYVMSRSVRLIPLVSLPDPNIYVIYMYTSTEVHQLQYLCPYYITDTLCHVKVSLTEYPGQSVGSPHLCHIYIHRSPSNTIY